jgi:hypothetical protein
MGSIGSYKYPDLSVPEATKIAKTIYDFPSHSMSVQLLAEKLKISARGGWTGMILFSLKRYGLAEGRGLLHTTPLGEKLVNPLTAKELQSTKEEVFNKIELWSRIHKDYGAKVPGSEFCSYLVEKLSVDRETAQSKYEKIAKLYTESVAFCFPPEPSSISIYDDGRGSETVTVEKRFQEAPVECTRVTPGGTVSYGSSEEYGIWVKKDIAAIEFAESQIEAIKAWLKLQKTKVMAEKAS